jgi:RimJ/RimL family protein N-acetyltransferase
VLELERIISFTVSENAASRRVMQKCGFVQQGETR